MGSRITKWIVVILLFPALNWGQDSLESGRTGNNHMFSKHHLSFQLGFTGQVENSTTFSGSGVKTISSVSGITGYFIYSYRFTPDWAFFIKSGALRAETSTQSDGYEVSSQTSTIVPFLLGAKFQPERFSLAGVMWPFLSLGLGPYFGFGTESSAGLTISNKTTSETAFGGRVGAGIEAILGRWFLLGFDVGYHLVSDFSSPLGNKTNYSGAEVMFTVGFVWGERITK